jgi:hypothetical protein
MTVSVRLAERGDVPALIRLRLPKGEGHFQLASSDAFRVADAEAGRRRLEESRGV